MLIWAFICFKFIYFYTYSWFVMSAGGKCVFRFSRMMIKHQWKMFIKHTLFKSNCSCRWLFINITSVLQFDWEKPRQKSVFFFNAFNVFIDTLRRKYRSYLGSLLLLIFHFIRSRNDSLNLMFWKKISGTLAEILHFKHDNLLSMFLEDE